MRVEHNPIGGEVDVAIVGAGVSGLYLAYRIARERPDLSVVVLESSGRLGGRLRSVCRGDGHVLECGAGFLSNAHTSAFALARNLHCPLIETQFRCGGMYLRGRRDQRAFALAPHEENRSAARLVLAALKQIAPDDQASGPSADVALDLERLRDVAVDGRPLWDWSIGALLRRSLSDEAFALARATHGSTAAFGDANALDALVTQAIESSPGQTFFQFEHGFESLALAMADAMPDVRAALGHRVVSVRSHRGRLCVRAATAQGSVELSAAHVFMALPQAALKRVRFGPDLARPWCATDINAVSPVKAFKLFLEFESAWWRTEVGALERGEIAATFTDLPLQQIYFQGAPGTRPTIMASFADSHAVDFWSSFRADPRQTDVVDSAPQAMVDAAMRELRRIYPFAPNAVGGVFADWARGGWHAWKTGVRSWEIAARIQQPNSEVPLFICGEAFSQLQGWTEGALNNAEAVLERALGLCRPPWLGVDVPFNMKGNENEDLRFLGSSR